MDVYSYVAAVVLGVRPKAQELHPQVISCLKAAKTILDGKGTDYIIPIGGDGHGGALMEAPESDYLARYLVETLGAEEKYIKSNGAPSTTPEVIWELRALISRYKIYWLRIVTIAERLERIRLLCDYLLPDLKVSFDVVPHVMQPSEQHTFEHEQYLLEQTQRELAGMEPGDLDEFCRRWSFRYHLWRSVIPEMRSRGELAGLLP